MPKEKKKKQTFGSFNTGPDKKQMFTKHFFNEWMDKWMNEKLFFNFKNYLSSPNKANQKGTDKTK